MIWSISYGKSWSISYGPYGMDYTGFENEPLVKENLKPFHKIKIPTTTPSEFLSNLVIFGKNV